MSHPLVLGLYGDRAAATSAARALRGLGIHSNQLSVVASSHEEQGLLAADMGGTPGAEMEDSRAAARIGELGGQILAAIAIVLPGIGPIVGAGPLSAGLGEAAGHMAGGIASILRKAGLPEGQAANWQSRVQQGAVLLGVHARREETGAIRTAMEAGAEELALAQWEWDGGLE
jgi:hypothetical protein